MSYFEWNKEFDLGITEMNDEHKVLISYMNTLYELSRKEAKKTSLLLAFDQLIEFTRKHFSDEERFMDTLGYPATVHKRLHADLLDRLDYYRGRLESGPALLQEDFFQFLRQWLSTHICGVDQDYGRFAKKK